MIYELLINSETKKFEFVLQRHIPSIDTKYDQSTYDFNSYNYYYYGGDQTLYFLSDKMKSYYISTAKEKVIYESQNLFDKVKDNFGKTEIKDEKGEFLNRTLKDLKIVCKNGGIAFFTSEEAWFLKIHESDDLVMPLKRLNFHMNKSQISINNIYPCIDSDKVVIDFIKGTKHLILVWDIVENKEVFNFSSDNLNLYMHGPNSQTGYIMDGKKYINLDKGLINYYFEVDFVSNTGIWDQKVGYRINKNEDIIILNGNIITKETIIETSCLDDLLDGTENITANNLNLERIRFQIDGNTILHYFALDYLRLGYCLDFFEEHRFEYLTAILMKNNKGKSPLDIALDNESPKNVELLLRKLILFKDMSLSGMFYDRFNQLLSMNIVSFHEFLDSCFFQTMQMKATKYLKLKSDKDPWLVPHSSCLIDNVFIEKYCRNDEKKIMDILARKKEREEKEKEEKLKRKAERKKAKIEKKKTELKLTDKGEKNETNGVLLDKQNSLENDPLGLENSLEQNGKTERTLKEDKKGPADITKQPTSAESANHPNKKPEDDIEVSDDDSDEETKDSKSKSKEELELEKERRKQKKLDIKAIEFDWIFNKVDGVEFMKTLSNTENIELFSLTMIRYIIKFMWSYYRKAILMYLFYPFFIYFWIFLVYTTWIHKKKFEENNDNGTYSIANITLVVICLVFQIYFLYYEIRQM